MDGLLRIALQSVFKRGNVKITAAGGSVFEVGDGTGKPVAIRFTTYKAQWATMFDPELRLGEAYMDGSFVVDSGSIADFLEVALGQETGGSPRWTVPHRILRFLGKRLQQFNLRERARRNVAHHYDLDGRLYSLFLDSDRQYSCAYFEHPNASLDDAQLAKKRHLAAKLLVNPDARVLDIGSGWGGLAIYLAKFFNAKVTGITLSTEQLGVARERAAEQDLAGSLEFRLQDYRDVTDKFDRIVSVGMFEHVGVVYYDAFFKKCAELLADDGVILLHSIGRSEGPNTTNAWIAKYIFPGGYIPALSEVMPSIERAGLLINDVEILRLHYAETLKAWRERFLAHREEVERLYDARFVRMWEFYLAASEMAFRQQNMMNFQLQLTKRQGIVPMTRDYIPDAEEKLRRAESRHKAPLRLAGE